MSTRPEPDGADDLAPDAIRRWREGRGMTQPQLAALVPTHWKTVQAWELGRQRPRGLYAHRLREIMRQDPPTA